MTGGTGSFAIEEHRHRFAVWAAARASQRGFTTVMQLRSALERSGIREALARQEFYDLGPEAFDECHRQWCRSICAALQAAGVPRVAYGRAAKVVAVYLKTVITMGAACDTVLGRNIHPPIDRILLRTLADEPAVESPHKAEWRRIRWTRLEQDDYERLIGQLREVVGADVPFWTIEKYWQPSNTAE